MKVCFTTSECVPYAKTGGLADVAGALPKALSAAGNEVKLFLPMYSSIKPEDHDLFTASELQNIAVTVGHNTHLINALYGKLPDSGVDVYLIDAPHYFHRGSLYTEDADEDERFILFQKAVIQIMQRYHWAPDILHCNDWQTGLLPVYLKYNFKWDSLFSETATVLSIHNIGYQGRFSGNSVFNAGLSYDHYYPGGPFELDNTFSFLKTGILFAEKLTTVSTTYAHEIQTPAYGHGLEGVLASRKADITGIVNGIDTDEWNPSKDNFIPQKYSIRRLAAKEKNKKALLEQIGLPYDESNAVLGIVSRFTEQKGLELLHPIMDDLMKNPIQIVALGSGKSQLEDYFRHAASKYPGKVGVYIGYNNELAHLITAGADIFLMPSRYEPCGLNQMYSLNYGTIPIVRRTGGLADTVKDYHEYYKKGNGFVFNDFDSEVLYLTIRRALDMYQNKPVWREIINRGMKQDFSWSVSAEKYLNVYEEAKEKVTKV